MNGTTFETAAPRPRFDRLAFALAAFVALLGLVVLVGNAVAAGAGFVVLGALGLAVGVALVTALPFLFVRAMSDVALR